jgi:CDP-diacylglycerol---glycerol-3-phosphate 3-phosphatidyltransferase
LRRQIHWPNALTALRVALVAPVVVLTLKRTELSDWIAFLAFGAAALTDGLDGYVARRMQLVSEVGQLWDPIADKILVAASMIALVIVGEFPAWAAAVIIAREVAVTALRWLAARRGRGFPASIAGKLKTGAQLFAVLFYILPVEGTAWHVVERTTLGIALALTVFSGAQYFMRAPALLEGGGTQRAG